MMGEGGRRSSVEREGGEKRDQARKYLLNYLGRVKYKTTEELLELSPYSLNYSLEP